MWRWLIALVALAVWAPPARAQGRFQVVQTRVELTERAPATVVEIANHGTTPLRLQVVATSWRDDIDGAMQLAETRDIVIRPSLLEIAPGGRRSVRVGTALRAGPAEQTYRIFFEELPDRRGGTANRIQVLTRIGIPVFVAAKQATRQASVAVATRGDAATIDVRALGTSHLKLARIAVRGLTGERTTWRREEIGWYVLSGAQRRFAIGIPADACGATDRVVAEIIDETGQAWSSEPRACGK